MDNSKHIDKIDFLRGIAILLVFLYHSQLCLYPSFSIQYGINHIIQLRDTKTTFLFLSPINYGWSGVSLFLIISGYLIHRGFLNNPKGFAIKKFYIKRFCRIYPPYILVLFFVVLTTSGFFYFFTRKGFIDVISHVLLVYNLKDSTYYSINPSFWSLAMEVQLYLLYPIFLLIRNKVGIVRTFFILFCFTILLNLTSGLLPDYIHNSVSYKSSAITNWPIWAIGALIAEIELMNKVIFKKRGFLIALSCYLLFILCKSYSYTDEIGYIFMFLGLVAFFEWFINTSYAINKYVFKIVSIVGICSYSIYLIHQPYLNRLFDFLSIIYYNHSKFKTVFIPLIVLLTFIIIFLISYGLYLFVERKSTQLSKNI